MPKKRKQDVKTQHYKHINQTPAMKLAVAGWHDLNQSMQDDGNVLVGWDNSAILGLVGDMPVGILTFSISEWERTYHVILGYVIPEHRRCGVYSALWAALVKHAKRNNICLIKGVTMKSNVSMRKTAHSLGRVEDAVRLTYRVL